MPDRNEDDNLIFLPKGFHYFIKKTGYIVAKRKRKYETVQEADEPEPNNHGRLGIVTGDSVGTEPSNHICKISEAFSWQKGLCNESFYYSPSDGKWGRKKKLGIQSYCCVVEKLLYGCDGYGNVFWRESEELEWNEVKGLESLRKTFLKPALRSSVFEKRVGKLSNFGVNIVVFWVGDRWDVWCAEISSERREDEGEVWGTIEWSEVVTTLDHAPFSRVAVEVLYSATVNV